MTDTVDKSKSTKFGYKFGPHSTKHLKTLHPLLGLVMVEAIKTSPVDFAITCGHRGREDQEAAYADGRSKVHYPNSKHNYWPSFAVDVVPIVNGKAEWNDIELWHKLADHILYTAHRMRVKLRWGGDWDGDGWSRHRGDKDEKFIDLPHFELML